MAANKSATELADGLRWIGWDWLAAAFLFLSTAGVVVWQNLHLAVLWDVSYVLENSWRIRLGDIPYRDFPFPYAPITFLVQSLIIQLGGRIFWHHIAYAAVIGGLGTVLAWRVLTHILRGVAAFRPLAFLLALPLVALGIYCVFPHPFYDPDCTFVVLLCVLLVLQAERKDFPPLRTFLTGVMLVVPVFVKQNTGLGFFASAAAAIVILLAIRKWRGARAAGYAWLLAGIVSGLAVALVAIHFAFGLGNYRHWTIQFAAARRLPATSDMLAPYGDPLLFAWLAAFAAGVLLLWRTRRSSSRSLQAISVALLALPFLWIFAALFIQPDAEDRAAALLSLWPFLLVVSLAAAIWNLRRGREVQRALPFILIGTVQGAFLSQQVWGSTYAIWPLFVLLFGVILATLSNFSADTNERGFVPLAAFAGIAVLSMLICGTFYVASEERLEYVDLSGDLHRSTLPALAGLSIRGPWIPQFEELVEFANREIPRDAGILMIPGEDLFYYATGRHPRFPVLMFDHTVNPYSPEEITALAREKNICWLVVKKNLQLAADPVEDKSRLLELLRADFAPVQSLPNYDIYLRQSDSGCAEASATQH
jgi:hypothetical protein